MARKKVYTHWDRPENKPEYNSGEVITNLKAARSNKDRIEGLLIAGQNLVQARIEAYDYEHEGKDDGFTDPTRSGNYDLADAHADSMANTERLRRQAVAAKEKKEAAAEAKRLKDEEVKLKKAIDEAQKTGQNATD